MNNISLRILGALWGAAMIAASAAAAPLTPNSGPVTLKGSLTDSDKQTGTFTVQANLKDGNFTGTATFEIGGQAIAGPLIERRSYLGNGRCYFRIENGRARAEVAGKCDSATLDGRFDLFLPGGDAHTGSATATIALAGGAVAAEASGRLPAGKLTCAYTETHVSFKWGEANQYSLHMSNLASLTLDPSGNYAVASGTRGRYTREPGGKIRLASGPWEGAIGTLENDRSGAPAVVFYLEENRRPDGVPIVDPYTTHCTRAR
jgi:hypothetical protein